MQVTTVKRRLKLLKKEIKRDIKDDPENADIHKDALKRTVQYIKHVKHTED